MRTRTNEPTTEQIQSICRMQATMAEKERLFLSIGLQTYEARALARMTTRGAIVTSQTETAAAVETEPTEVVWLATAERARQMLAHYTVGVEIECFARNTQIVENCRNNGLVCNIESYNHEDRQGAFKLVSDASVCGCENPTECVSPVLQYGESGEKINKICRALAESNAKVNKTCGLHIHVGADSLTDAEYCAVFVNYMYLSPLIETFLAPSRRTGCEWCKHLSRNESRVLAADSKFAMSVALHRDRYYEVNAMANERHHTIEFRHHQGTVESVKILNWLAFCVKLVEWSKTNRLNRENAPQTIDEIEFLNTDEKNYFKARAQHFARVAAAAA